jgi:hypothetical protein
MALEALKTSVAFIHDVEESRMVPTTEAQLPAKSLSHDTMWISARADRTYTDIWGRHG